MEIGTNTEFPKNLGEIPDNIKAPEGHVFKYVMYGVGVLDYKYDKQADTWKVCKGETFLVNHQKDLSPLSASTLVATTTSVALDEHGNTHKGVLKSLIPGDTSFATGESLAFHYDPKTNISKWNLGKLKQTQGVFSDITYMIGHHETRHNLTEGSFPDGTVRSVTIDITGLYYGQG